ncbi:MAG: metalloregulator ArsR/SmtB family transcription factor [Acidobacteriota bacterium]
MTTDDTSARPADAPPAEAPCACPPAAAARSRGDADADLARLCKALAHPARVHIVRLLAARSTCVCGELVVELDLAQSTVSQHLKILKDAGLVRGEIQGPRTCYCLEPVALADLGRLVDGLADPAATEPPATVHTLPEGIPAP